MVRTTVEQQEAFLRWRAPLFSIAICLSALILAYWTTLESMIRIWYHSETFAHGFVIFPIAAYLVWRKKDKIATRSPSPDLRAVAGILLMGAIWIVANMAGIQVVQQLVLVVQIIFCVWAVLGLGVVREIFFPLAFLFFSVPFGEALVPWLVQFTADFTVGMVRFTGIPIYRDGNTFSLPTGNWSVVEACSGIRYLIASLTLGFLYAYLNYKSFWQRIAFIAISLIVPIFANGLRAFMIVMIGHFSGMKLAVGVDHLIYGWLFFGLVIAFMFWIGSFLKHDQTDSRDPPVHTENVSACPRPYRFVLITLVAFGCAAIWPFKASILLAADQNSVSSARLNVPNPVDGWHRLESVADNWRPEYQGANSEVDSAYSDSTHQPVRLFVYLYRSQEKNRELINSANVVVRSNDKVWRLLDVERIDPKLAGWSFPVNQWRLGSPGKNLTVWEWYWVDGQFVSEDILAKLLEIKAKLFGGIRDSAALIIAVEHPDSETDAAGILRRFLGEMLPSIKESLHSAAER